jgi:regulator of replication initiation timing
VASNSQNDIVARLTTDNQKLMTENTQLKVDLASLREKYDRLKAQSPTSEPSADILGAFFTELPAPPQPERRKSAVPDESISELLSLFAPK